MLAIDARETAPASASQHMYHNSTELHFGISQFLSSLLSSLLTQLTLSVLHFF